MYRYNNNSSDFNGDHPNFKLVRDWYVWDCDYHKGLRLIRKTGVNRGFIDRLEQCEKVKAIGIMRKILNTVDAFTGKTSFDLSKIDFEEKKEDQSVEQNKNIESLDPIKDLATMEGLGMDISSPSPATIEPVKTINPTHPKEEIVYHAPPSPEEKEIIEHIPPSPEGEKPKNNWRESEEYQNWKDVSIPNDAPKEVKELKEKAIKLHKKQAYLHANLSFAETDKERYKIAVEIMEEIIPSLSKIYDQIRGWKKTGVVPLAPVEDEFKKGVEMMQKRESLRTRILKIKRTLSKNLEKLETKQIKKYDKELKAKELEFLKIERILKNL